MTPRHSLLSLLSPQTTSRTPQSKHLPLLCFLLILTLTPTPTSTDWTSECVSRYPASCRCTWSSGKRSADCSKSNMNSLPSLSSEIQILDMSHNKLTQLGDNAFTNANLINVQKLYLKGCRITKIHDLAFNNLRILIEVDLSFNELEVIDPVVFSTNVRLRVIKLNNNKLHVVKEFPVLEYVNTVDLSYNAISNFSSYNTFVGLRNLKVLDISYNQFGNVDPEIFPRLSSLSLRGNNWVCDCELKPLRDYVMANKFHEAEVKCSEPLNLYMSQWDGFDDLSCKPEILRILANGKVVDSIVALENTLVLSCVVRGEPLPDVKWVKNGRVVQDALMSVHEVERTVMLNLTVGRHDNEFVCVGSNSGGVVERNLTITVDDAGLSGFVVLKDGIDRDGMSGNGNGIIGFRGERGSLVVYLVIGVVFLSLVVGLIVGGVCVWKWGKVRELRDGDTVVKSVIKDESGVGKVADERGDMIVMTSGLVRTGGGNNPGGGSVQFNPEQSPLLKPHTSADDLLDDRTYDPITPDLLINNSNAEEDEDEEESYAGKFPLQQQQQCDNTSVYDNYDSVMYNKPLITGADSLRRYAFLRSNDGSKTPVYSSSSGMMGHSLPRPSSVCSEPRGGSFQSGGGGSSNRRRMSGSSGSGGVQPQFSTNTTVILPHGYVTLPRRSMREKNNGNLIAVPGSIKYDNLGPRSTADGCSNFSLNKCGVDPATQQQQQQPPPTPADQQQQHPHHHQIYSNVSEQESLLYDQLIMSPNSLQNQNIPPDPQTPQQQQQQQSSPLKILSSNIFDPIPEDPSNEIDDEDDQHHDDDHEKQEESSQQPQVNKKQKLTPPQPPPKPQNPSSSSSTNTGTDQPAPAAAGKKYRPVPPPKPQKNNNKLINNKTENLDLTVDDDGTEV